MTLQQINGPKKKKNSKFWKAMGEDFSIQKMIVLSRLILFRLFMQCQSFCLVAWESGNSYIIIAYNFHALCSKFKKYETHLIMTYKGNVKIHKQHFKIRFLIKILLSLWVCRDECISNLFVVIFFWSYNLRIYSFLLSLLC